MQRNKLTKLIKVIKEDLIQDVPNELAACEICRKKECSEALWENCENRINLMKKLNNSNED